MCCFLGWPFPVEELEAILPSSLTGDVGGNVQREPVILKDSLGSGESSGLRASPSD